MTLLKGSKLFYFSLQLKYFSPFLTFVLYKILIKLERLYIYFFNELLTCEREYIYIYIYKVKQKN